MRRNTFMIWFHRFVLRHEQAHVRVSVPSFDISARGILVKCSCGKDWAL